MADQKITIGKYTISIDQYPIDLGGHKFVSIYCDDGEGGGFDLEKFEKLIDVFYKENF